MPLDLDLLQLYLAAAVLLVLVPGPDSLLILSRSLFEGRWMGWIASFGTAAGNVLHAVLAAAGVSALVAASPALFDTVRLLGAAYLLWLGLRALAAAWRAWRAGGGQAVPTLPATGPRRAFVHAFLTNILNPKVILFYLAFVPQFVSPAVGSIALQTLLLGLILAGMATLYHLLLASLAARTAQKLLSTRLFATLLNGFTGLLFVGFAVRVFLTERKAA